MTHRIAVLTETNAYRTQHPVKVTIDGELHDWPVAGLEATFRQAGSRSSNYREIVSLQYEGETYISDRSLGDRKLDWQTWVHGTLYRPMRGLYATVIDGMRPGDWTPDRQAAEATAESAIRCYRDVERFALCTLVQHDGRDWQPVAEIDTRTATWRELANDEPEDAPTSPGSEAPAAEAEIDPIDFTTDDLEAQAEAIVAHMTGLSMTGPWVRGAVEVVTPTAQFTVIHKTLSRLIYTKAEAEGWTFFSGGRRWVPAGYWSMAA